MASFYELLPENILNGVEECGFEPTGIYRQLNSYENRVFDLDLESGESVVAKFYRPGRWSFEAICDEHEFLTKKERPEMTKIVAWAASLGDRSENADYICHVE